MPQTPVTYPYYSSKPRRNPLAVLINADLNARAITRDDPPPLRCHWRPTWCPRWLWSRQWIRALIWRCRHD